MIDQTFLSGFGRFIPDRYALTNRGTLAPACAGGTPFTYLGQNFGITGIQVQAQNASAAVTQNYTGAFGPGTYVKLDPASFAAFNAGARALDAPGTNLTTRIDPGSTASGSWTSGVLTLALSPLRINRVPPATADDPSGPFDQTRVGIAPTDTDSVGMQAAAFDLDVDGDALNEHAQLVGVGALGDVRQRYGRLRILNALGTEKLALPVSIRTEYWNVNVGVFVTNAADSCTSLARNAIALGSYTGALNPMGGNCKTFIQQDPVSFAAGVGTLSLAAPSPAGTSGSVLLTPQLSRW